MTAIRGGSRSDR